MRGLFCCNKTVQLILFVLTVRCCVMFAVTVLAFPWTAAGVTLALYGLTRRIRQNAFAARARHASAQPVRATGTARGGLRLHAVIMQKRPWRIRTRKIRRQATSRAACTTGESF